MPRTRPLGVLLVAAATLLFAASATTAEAHGSSTDRFFSDAGFWIYIGAGVGLPLLEDGAAGRTETLRTADALLTSVLISEGLKRAVHEWRPDRSDKKSFPSGHVTGAFAIAAMESQFHPRQAPYWYLGAVLIGNSRIRLYKHHFGDVLAGAAIGYGTARLEVSLPRGLVLFPFIRGDGSVMGIQATLPL